MKGSDYERELFKKLWDKGYAVMRSPTSGGGRKEPQPDLLFSNGISVAGIECKSTQSEKVYLSKEEVRDLVEFCNRFGATPVIAVRWAYIGWTFHMPDDCRFTNKSVVVDKDTPSIEMGAII